MLNIFLYIVLFYVIPTIISIIGDIYNAHYHVYDTFLNLTLKEDLKNAKTVGEFLDCLQINFIPVANIFFTFVFLWILLYDLLKLIFKFITKITKLDILWKKIMNIKIRK